MIDIPATITAVGAVITAVGVILVAWWSYRAKERAADAADKAQAAADLGARAVGELAVIRGEVREVGARIDGRLSELLTSSNSLARAEGVQAGEQAQRDRQSEPSK